jgi:hypothetical protein
MQKTLIDPFELASRTLPVPSLAPVPEELNITPNDPAAEESSVVPPPGRTPRAEAWSRVRCWCSED